MAAALMGWITGNEVVGMILLLGISAIIGLNVLRFGLWGVIHRKYPISKAYPLTAVFFPLLALMEYFKGESIQLHQWVGVAFVTLGVFWISLTVENEQEADQ